MPMYKSNEGARMGFPRQRGLSRPLGLETPDNRAITIPSLALDRNRLLFLRAFMSLKGPDQEV